MSATIGNKSDRRNPSSGYSGAEEHSGPLHSFLEHSTLLIFPVVFLLNLHWAGSRLYELELLWLVALAVPLTAPVTGDSIPDAMEHLDFFPARLLAVLGNSLGTIAVVAVALLTIRRRPVGNALIVAGVAVAAAGSGLAGLGVAETAVFVAVAAALLYVGFTRAGGRRAV